MNGGNPFALHALLRAVHRRDTIAFMPQWIEALKFADDQEELDEPLNGDDENAGDKSASGRSPEDSGGFQLSTPTRLNGNIDLFMT